jgi:hypothetical protein
MHNMSKAITERSSCSRFGKFVPGPAITQDGKQKLKDDPEVSEQSIPTGRQQSARLESCGSSVAKVRGTPV